MCDLCSNGIDGERARKSALDFSTELESLKNMYVALGTRRIDPHTDKAKKVAQLARAVVRRLVEEWI